MFRFFEFFQMVGDIAETLNDLRIEFENMGIEVIDVPTVKPFCVECGRDDGETPLCVDCRNERGEAVDFLAEQSGVIDADYNESATFYVAGR